MGVGYVDPSVDGNLSIEYFFQRTVYVCASCTKGYELLHPLILLVMAAVCVWMTLSLWQSGRSSIELGHDGLELKGRIGALLPSLIMGPFLTLDLYRRLRHPRIV